MATLILHIGYPKTGTTMLQATLDKNRLRFRLAGLDYFAPPQKTTDNSINHEWFAHKLMFEPALNSIVSLREVAEWVRSSNSRYCMLSSEVFCLLPSDRIDTLYEVFRRLDVRILVWVRSQPEAINSRYLQAIKAGNKIVDFTDYLKREIRSGNYHYSNILERWSVFGQENLIVRVYDRSAFYNRDIMSDFLEVVGLEVSWLQPDFTEIDKLIVGPKSYAILEALIYHPEGYCKPARDKLVVHERHHSLAFKYLRHALESLNLDEKLINLLTREHMKYCDDAYSKDNDYVARKYLGHKNGKLFLQPSKIGFPNEYSSKLCEEDWIRVLGSLLSYIEDTGIAIKEVLDPNNIKIK